MKRIFIAMCCVAVVALMSSCIGKSDTDMILDGFEDLIEDVEKQKGDLTVEEWAKMQEDFNKRFEELGIEDFDETELSAVDKMKLIALTVRWTAAMAESAPALMESALEELDKQ